MSDLAGKTVAGYPIEKLLAKGSYADTWQVRTSDTPLAVKIVHTQYQADAALNAEISKGWDASRAAQHENLVLAYSAAIEPGLGAYCLQEFVRGKPLRQLVQDAAKLAWRDFLITAEQIVAALHALHEAKVLHGDVWPGAILMTQDQDLKLEGAGGLMQLSGRSAEMLTGPGIAYQAPEVLAGCPISIESDIYGVGATLYALLASHDPYPPEPAERLLQIVTDKRLPKVTALRDDLPPESEQLLARLLAHNPRERYASAADLLADIKRLKAGEALAPLRGGKAPAAPKPSKRPPVKPKSNVAPAVAAAKTASNIKAVSGFSPAIKPSSGVSGPLKPPSGLAAAVGASASGLRAIKEGTAAKNIFGRLDTHVKSTIPQSDVEKKGDNSYRQGNLSLALNAWREAYESSPHTGLKVKIDLAERDLKQQTVAAALQEARMLLDDGDYANAIARAQEALLASDDDLQRQEALRLEHEAGEKSLAHKQSSRMKMIVAAAVGLVIIVLAALLLFRGKKGPQDSAGVSGGSQSQDLSFKIASGEATVSYMAPWSPAGNGLSAAGTDEPVTFSAARLQGSAAMATLLDRIRAGKTLLQPATLEDNSSAFTVDEKYPVTMIGVRYMGKQKRSYIHYFFVLTGPSQTAYLAEFDAREDLFTSDIRKQMLSIMKSWHYMDASP